MLDPRHNGGEYGSYVLGYCSRHFDLSKNTTSHGTMLCEARQRDCGNLGPPQATKIDGPELPQRVSCGGQVQIRKMLPRFYLFI